MVGITAPFLCFDFSRFLVANAIKISVAAVAEYAGADIQTQQPSVEFRPLCLLGLLLNNRLKEVRTRLQITLRNIANSPAEISHYINSGCSTARTWTGGSELSQKITLLHTGDDQMDFAFPTEVVIIRSKFESTKRQRV